MKISDEEGMATPEFVRFLSQTITELQINLNNEGYKVPALETTDIAKLTDADKSNGTIIQDSTTGLPMFNVNGTWMTITVT
jgi:hypothetical protein